MPLVNKNAQSRQTKDSSSQKLPTSLPVANMCTTWTIMCTVRLESDISGYMEPWPAQAEIVYFVLYRLAQFPNEIYVAIVISISYVQNMILGEFYRFTPNATPPKSCTDVHVHVKNVPLPGLPGASRDTCNCHKTGIFFSCIHNYHSFNLHNKKLWNIAQVIVSWSFSKCKKCEC